MKKDFEQTENLARLYDFYKGLFTTKQQEYFELYFFEDYSLAEIGEMKQVSRNAIYSSLSQMAQTLAYYETTLKLYHKSVLREALYQTIQDAQLVQQLRTIDEN